MFKLKLPLIGKEVYYRGGKDQSKYRVRVQFTRFKFKCLNHINRNPTCPGGSAVKWTNETIYEEIQSVYIVLHLCSGGPCLISISWGALAMKRYKTPASNYSFIK